MKRAGFCALFLSLAAVVASASQQKPLLHALFTDHAVLQRGVPVSVWGWTAPQSEVTVEIGGKTAKAVSRSDGKWLARIGPFEAGGPYKLVVTDQRGGRSVTEEDILFGDVWLCSGQSNMEMGIRLVRNAEKEIAEAHYPNLRLFAVPRRIALREQELVESSWKRCTPHTVAEGGWGGFSAVAYFFGRFLHRELGVPIGLIHSSWGGTVAEAWTSAGSLMRLEDFRDAVRALRESAAALAGGQEKFEELMERWWQANDPPSRGKAAWSRPSFNDTSWKTMNLPGAWEQRGLGGFDGIVWFRKTFEVPAELAGKKATLSLGAVDDRDTTWINGVRIGSMSAWNVARRYSVPAGVLKAGKNCIAVRVLDTGGGGGFIGRPAHLYLKAGERNIPLSGPWRYRVSVPLSKTTAPPQRVGRNPNVPTVLFNGMIAPLVPFAIKGAIWYQGESNSGRPIQYRRLLPTLIADWRSHFEVGDFAFLVVQLANFMAVQRQPSEGGWALLREAQLLTSLRVPKVGLAVTIDIGEARDIHPKNKQDVGKRLALAALGIAYGRRIEYSGPIYRKMRIEGNKIRLFFDHTGSGLEARGGTPKGFAIAGQDRKFVWAKAAIEGDTVVVWSPEVKHPRAVRYGWANNPVCNLYNKEGLPASPFRTDSWEK